MKDDRLENLLDWYEETNPSLGDLENELDYHNIDLTAEKFLKIFERDRQKTVPIEQYLERVKALAKEVKDLSLENMRLKDEIRKANTLFFSTKNYDVEVKKDFSWGWFEHREIGEELGGNFTVETNINCDMEIVDMDYCYDIPKEVLEVLKDETPIRGIAGIWDA